MSNDINTNDIKKEKEDVKWDFAEYAYTITGIIVGFLLVAPELLYSFFGIRILGGSLGEVAPEILEGLGDGPSEGMFNINRLRSLSPLLFLLTVTITLFKDAFDARKSGEIKGSMFTHTFESLFDDAIYMAITTIMLYAAVLFGAIYISWLGGPISWILFVLIFPLVRKKSDDADRANVPWILLLIFVAGIITEVFTGIWLAFPLSWLVICAIKLITIIRNKITTIDAVFETIYYAFSVILMAVGIILNFWIASWTAFPSALIICWILRKHKRFKTVEADDQNNTA
ncbi:MAG: hypothetical protein FWD05_08085 [Oscillospiraceae bacterium]|nr:hypothetical protein [Oscillospiraceae bacterium]